MRSKYILNRILLTEFQSSTSFCTTTQHINRAFVKTCPGRVNGVYRNPGDNLIITSVLRPGPVSNYRTVLLQKINQYKKTKPRLIMCRVE